MMEGHSRRSSARIPMSREFKLLLASSFLNDIRNGQTVRFDTPPAGSFCLDDFGYNDG